MVAPPPEAVPAGVGACPVRKLSRAEDASAPLIEYRDDDPGPRWVIRSFTPARALLRQSEGLRQAGFGAERVGTGTETRERGPRMRPPILFLEGEAHRSQRRAAARLFAPTVTEGYRPAISVLSRELVARVRPDRMVDLSDLSLRMAVQVAASVIGLTSSSMRGMTRRLDTFFEGDPLAGGRNPVALARLLRRSTAMLRFYHQDVKPAVRARRRARARGEEPAEDLISQLIGAGFSDLEILTECITYGAAGMVTTRELITMACWHLLDSPELLQRYRAGDTAARQQVLQETLRLEPVVGRLYRRTTAPVTLETADGPLELAVGTLVDIDVRAVNVEAATVGEQPLGLCPERDLPRTVPPSLLSFGDGHHRCPGAPLAILESEIFLTELLRHDLVADGPPTVRWNALTQGYDLDQFMVRRLG